MGRFQQSRLLQSGMQAPDFELPDQNGNPVRLSDALRQGWVVLFFYPRDHSPVCTNQVCAFRDAHADFQAAGASVIGISSDSSVSHRRFADNHRLPFPLLSDTGNRIANAYGVSKVLGLIPDRVTFVMDPEGMIRMAYSSQWMANAHMTRALAFIRNAQPP